MIYLANIRFWYEETYDKKYFTDVCLVAGDTMEEAMKVITETYANDVIENCKLSRISNYHNEKNLVLLASHLDCNKNSATDDYMLTGNFYSDDCDIVKKV